MSDDKKPGLDFEAILGKAKNTLFEDFVASLARLMECGLSQQPHSTQQLVDDNLGTGSSLAAVVGLDPVVVTVVLIKPGSPNLPLFQVTEETTWH